MYYFSYNNYMDYTNNKKLENIKKINYLEEEKENYIRTDEILEKEQIKNIIKISSNQVKAETIIFEIIK